VEASGAAGLGAYWVVDSFGHLIRIDALTNRVTGRYTIPLENFGSCTTPSWFPGVVGPVFVNRSLWFAQCNPNRLVEFDPSTRRSATFAIPQEVGWLLTVPGVHDEVWLFDPHGGTVTPFSTESKTMG
jgi:streptogramin lyase